jgi:hypothetical protein
MLKIRMPLLLAAAVCAFAISAAPAMAFTEFQQKAAKSGNQGKGGKQVFKTKAGEVICEEEKSNGGSVVEKQTKAAEEAKYEKCKAFGATPTISPAKYNFKATDNTVEIANTILIKAEPFGAKCEVEVSPAGNSALGGINYTNIGKDEGITIKALQKEIITYKVLKNGGGLCGTEGEAKNGTYEGEAKTEKYTGELGQWNGKESVKQLSYADLQII